MSDIRCVVDARCRLGEGPLWDARSARVFWFDIKDLKLWWHDPASLAHGSWDLPVRCSAAAPRTAGGLIVASEKGLGQFDTTSGAFELVEPVDLGPGFRSNEGKIDVSGRFWWSAMDDDGGKRPGWIYCKRPGQASRRIVDGVHIPNTLSCSPDGRTLYLADTTKKTLYAYAVDPQTDALTDGRPFIDTHGAAGAPDGSAVDADGYVWNAQWGAWRIVRYAPDGRVDRIVETPVQQPSSCIFGGPDLATLYVTSARESLSEAALEAQPQAGALFAFEPGVRGLPLPSFAG